MNNLLTSENSFIIFYILAFISLAIVIREVYKRTRKVPLVKVMARQEALPQEQEIKETFEQRAARIGWEVDKGYRSKCMVIAIVAGSVMAFVMQTWLPIPILIAAGFMIPRYRLSQREEAYYDELPLKAEQALGTVEQQIDSDIPIFDALKQAIPYMQEPLKSKYAKVVEKVEKTGIPLQQALEGIPAELNLPQLEYFHIILEVAQETEEKAREIISDASETIRRQQRQAVRFKQEVSASRTETKLMFGLVCVMVGSLFLMLPDTLPLKGTPFNIALDVGAITLSGWITWMSLRSIQAKNIF